MIPFVSKLRNEFAFSSFLIFDLYDLFSCKNVSYSLLFSHVYLRLQGVIFTLNVHIVFQLSGTFLFEEELHTSHDEGILHTYPKIFWLTLFIAIIRKGLPCYLHRTVYIDHNDYKLVELVELTIIKASQVSAFSAFSITPIHLLKFTIMGTLNYHYSIANVAKYCVHKLTTLGTSITALDPRNKSIDLSSTLLTFRNYSPGSIRSTHTVYWYAQKSQDPPLNNYGCDLDPLISHCYSLHFCHSLQIENLDVNESILRCSNGRMITNDYDKDRPRKIVMKMVLSAVKDVANGADVEVLGEASGVVDTESANVSGVDMDIVINTFQEMMLNTVRLLLFFLCTVDVNGDKMTIENEMNNSPEIVIELTTVVYVPKSIYSPDKTLKNEDEIEYFHWHKFYCYYYQFDSDIDKEIFDIVFRCNITFVSLCLLLYLDTSNAHKGSMLYATPQNLQIDHFVIIISTIKGKAICDTPTTFTFIFNLKTEVLSITKDKKLANTRYIVCLNVILNKLYHNNELEGHRTILVRNKLQHDIELNPGPPKHISINIITINCRGLGYVDKCRLLLNRINRIINNNPAVVMLQETMILTDDYFKLAWRGKYIHTPGTGNSQGCITLLPCTAKIITTDHFGTRGHYVKVQNLLANEEEVITICNIYAPNGFGPDKSEFFNSVFDRIASFNGNTILGGDINTTLGDSDRHNRGVTAAELRIADLILNKVDELNLNDSWSNSNGFTWSRGQVMSKLDRIFFRINNYRLKSNVTDWTVTSSDHAAVIVTLEHCEITKHKNDHVKLDNEIIKNPIFLNEIREYFN